jgi:hypothetical protein
MAISRFLTIGRSNEECPVRAAVANLSFVCLSLIAMGLVWVNINEAGVRPENIAGLWTFDEGNGDTAHDVSGNQNHGKLNGDTKWVNGKFGKALQFDGDMDYVEVVHDETLNITEELSIVAWVKFEQIPVRENVLLDKGPKLAQAQYYLGYEPAEDAYFLNFNGQGWHAGDNFNSPKTKDTDWHHVAVTFDTASGKIKACVDGVCNEHETDDFLVNKGEHNLIIGDARFLETNRNFSYTGIIDEIGVYNVVLTPDEIKTLAAGSMAGVALDGKLATTWAELNRR